MTTIIIKKDVEYLSTKYYKIAILKQKIEPLSYSSSYPLKRGDIVNIPLKGSIKKGVVIEETQKPPFITKEISSFTPLFYSQEQFEIAQFISKYYISSLGEALSLFIPFNKEINYSFPKINIKTPNLTPIQQDALNKILSYKSSLLFGVTGSGKSEVFFKAIENSLKNKNSALILMPEIALTPQMEERLRKYFGDIVGLWHSKLKKRDKEEILEKILKGDIQIVAGARSALFLPFRNLGLIVVDEEHDDSFKQNKRPRYNAKDLSIYIGEKFNKRVILSSATPLVSSYYNLPVIKIDKPFIESKKEYFFVAGEEINYKIIQAIEENFKKNEQTLIFVPTRANFKYLICSNCGKTQLCPFCSIGMSLHKKEGYFQCHYCNFKEPIRKECQYCQGELVAYRMGTQEVIEEIKKEIKDIRVEQFDRDSITTLNKLQKALDRIKKKEVDLIVGTQMLSKGHDYPDITLSIILGLDLISAIGDFRAKERAISLMHQIAGRSGRRKSAKVIIQTSQPLFFKKYLFSYEDFIKDELIFRKDLYPPFRYLARVLIAKSNYSKGEELLNMALERLKLIKEIEIVGAGKAPIEKIANKYRFNILLRAKKRKDLLKGVNFLRDLDLEIDMDPVDFT